MPHALPAPRRLFRLCAALAIALAVGLPPALCNAADIVVRELDGATFDDAAMALEDAIAAEGLAQPTVNPFGEMLARTATDLGHRPDLYQEARIYTFCSARVAAMLAAEAAHNAALCPMSVTLYTVPPRHDRVFLAYRPTGLHSPGGELADALLLRIARRTAAAVAPASTQAPVVSDPIQPATASDIH